MKNRLLIKNALIVTMNKHYDVYSGDILVSGSRIESVDRKIPIKTDYVFDASDYIIVPGIIQTHVHLCQALFRNLADDLALLDWLEKRILPYENGHTAETMQVSAKLGLAEMIKCGTTTIMDFGSIRHQDVIFEALDVSGIRAFAGKTMMDTGVMPDGMKESTKDSIDESVRLLKKWHNFDKGRIRYAFAPRFVISCSEELLKETGRLAQEYDTLLHTHASENIKETELVEKNFGIRNILLFDKLGIAGENLCLAHCIWTNEDEKALLKEKDIKVLHCPSANLKLGSGIAPIPEYLEDGITVSLGSDGAPCNNNMDIFTEMRLASLIQKPSHGPETMSALETFKLATISGARALGIEKETGSIDIGKAADLTFIKNSQVHSIPYENIYSKLVYSTKSTDVDHVMINGQWVMKNRDLQTIDEELLINEVKRLHP
jgi:5-methylthioadenosine/S-adenosylhomocysteine deaminase